MKLLLCSVALSFSLLADAVAVHPNVVPPGLSLQFFVDKNQNFCLGATANQDGAAIVTVPCGASGVNTFWTVPNGGPGTGVITMFGDKCLDVPNGVNNDGTKLQLFSCTNNNNKNQQWTVSNDLTIQWAGTNKVVDNTDGALLAAGNPTQIWTRGTNNINQKWLPSSFDPTGVAPGGVAFILIPRKATGDFGCLTAESNVDGAPIVFQVCDGSSANQQWVLTGGAPPSTTTTQGGVGNLQVFGDKCLDVTNGSTANGVKLQIFTCGTGNPNQQWNVNGDGTISWSGKNKCVDLTNGIQTDGTPVQSFSCSSTNTNQIWFIDPEP